MTARERLQRPNHFARVARCYYVVWNVFSHYAACADSCVFANRHARTDNRAAANPHVVTNPNRRSQLLPV